MPKWTEFAHLAAAAQYRDGLFSVLDAGITSFSVPDTPALIEITVIAQFAFTEPDTGPETTFTLAVIDPNGLQLAGVSSEVQSTRLLNADMEFPVTWTVAQRFAITAHLLGYYRVRITLAPDLAKELKFVVNRAV